MKRSIRLIVLVMALVLIAGLSEMVRGPGWESPLVEQPTVTFSPEVILAGEQTILESFQEGRSGVVVQSVGVVERMLPDDEEGDRHQRFILRLASGHTVLVSHGIDVAPRAPVAVADTVQFRGEYEWNEEGGVIHWTHHDPQGERPGGYLRCKGRTYR